MTSLELNIAYTAQERSNEVNCLSKSQLSFNLYKLGVPNSRAAQKSDRKVSKS